jgi:3-hydroxy-9,10-secoandrosta-1,3,5(10)-triene-9,17-dione monooxygenase
MTVSATLDRFATTLTLSAASTHKQRASELVQRFRARATQAEVLRRLPDENIADLRAAGLFKLMLPARVGGHQASLHDFIDAVAEVARGCGSSGWVLGVVNAHHWLIGSFAQQAQDDVFVANPDAIISAVIGPRGKATKVAGGYTLNGFWPFCSGSPAANWVMLGGEVIGDNGVPIDGADFLIPVADIDIKDDWDVTGLRGSGSNSVVCKDVFVPEHRYLSMPRAIAGDTPGGAHHNGAKLYTSAIVPVLALGIVPAALGIAEGALEVFMQRLPGKVVSYTMGELQQDMPTTHMQVALAASKISAARLIMHNVADMITQAADSGVAMSLEDRARTRMDCAFGVRLCLEATEIVFLASGGAGLAVGSPIQRAARDVHAINLHGLLNLETNLQMYGRVLLGLPQNTPLI